jgi:hypothetical protein
MVQRTYNKFSEEDDDDYKKLSALDKQIKCDKCGQEIGNTRVIMHSGGKWVGVFCSHKCST